MGRVRGHSRGDVSRAMGASGRRPGMGMGAGWRAGESAGARGAHVRGRRGGHLGEDEEDDLPGSYREN